MKLILDFIPNHTSRNHSWFQSSVNNDPGYADFYIWHTGSKAADGTTLPPNNWVSLIFVILCFVYTIQWLFLMFLVYS